MPGISPHILFGASINRQYGARPDAYPHTPVSRGVRSIYRYYNADLGRWQSRDPIWERQALAASKSQIERLRLLERKTGLEDDLSRAPMGGEFYRMLTEELREVTEVYDGLGATASWRHGDPNLYTFVNNSALHLIDKLGLYAYCYFHGEGPKKEIPAPGWKEGMWDPPKAFLEEGISLGRHKAQWNCWVKFRQKGHWRCCLPDGTYTRWRTKVRTWGRHVKKSVWVEVELWPNGAGYDYRVPGPGDTCP